jgi:cellulose synthase/poly-beta-1,6-N-acetylglucosamine synthase-like glycosyltransferase
MDMMVKPGTSSRSSFERPAVMAVFYCLFMVTLVGAAGWASSASLPWTARLPALCLLMAYVGVNVYTASLNWFAKKIPEARVSSPRRYPPLAVVIVSYREPLDVALMTLMSAVNCRYPGSKRFLVVDNSPAGSQLERWRSLAIRVGALFIHSPSSDKKPGNLDVAMASLLPEIELILFLDVDSTVPDDGDFLSDAVLAFENDERLAFVQFVSRATNWRFNRLSRFGGVWQDLRQCRLATASRGGFPVFYGHNAVWRRAALDTLGKWTARLGSETIVSEDTHMCCRARLAGWHGVYSPHVLGEWVPNSLTAMGKMWTRWTVGTAQVTESLGRALISSRSFSRAEAVDFLQHLLNYVAPLAIYILMIVTFLVHAPVLAALALAAWLMPELSGMPLMWRLSHSRGVRRRLADMGGAVLVKLTSEFICLTALLGYLVGRNRSHWLLTDKGMSGKPARGLALAMTAVGAAYFVGAAVVITVYKNGTAIAGGLFGLAHLAAALVFKDCHRNEGDTVDTATIQTA